MSAERTRRRRPPIPVDLGGDEKDADCEGCDVVDGDDDVESRGGDIGDSAKEFCLAGVGGIAAGITAGLVTKMHKDAQQSRMAKVAPFHNFILERIGALKLCKASKEDNEEHGYMYSPFLLAPGPQGYTTSNLLSLPAL